MSGSFPIATLILLPLPLLAVPTGTNLSFESGLTGWTASSVSVESGFSFDGSHRLDLQSGFVEQTFTGLTTGQPHFLSIAYLYQESAGALADARVFLDGVAIGDFHTRQSNEYLSSNGFEFVPSATSITLRIESLETGSSGLLIDDIQITQGNRPAPPQEPWANLTLLPGGDRQLVNGGFETPIGDPTTDPDNSGPAGNEHLSGRSLPGWLVTRENVDVIQFNNANPPEGNNVLDTSGHGPGGIAQTITNLTPGGAYTFSFQYARHRWWETQDMTGEVLVNGQLAKSLIRTISQTWDDGYELIQIPAIATQSGTLTIEVISTVTNKGGSIVYDDFRISEGAELFDEWASNFGATPELLANDDHDAFANGFDFLFGFNPTTSDSPLNATSEGDDLILDVPIAGVALSQGFQVELMTSRDMINWVPASDAQSGVTLQFDTSSMGVDGLRRYYISPSQSRLFWTHRLTPP